jgi:hypothetical protein
VREDVLACVAELRETGLERGRGRRRDRGAGPLALRLKEEGESVRAGARVSSNSGPFINQQQQSTGRARIRKHDGESTTRGEQEGRRCAPDSRSILDGVLDTARGGDVCAELPRARRARRVVRWVGRRRVGLLLADSFGFGGDCTTGYYLYDCQMEEGRR